MSLLQRVKFYGQERLDIPDLQAMQNLTAADFSQIFDKVISDSAHIITGFEVPSPRSVINTLTSAGLPITIANSVLFNSFSFNLGTQGGAFYVATPSEAQQVATLVAGTTNYVEIELSIATTTPDTRKFWDPDKNIEFSQIVDTVDYVDAIITSNTVAFTDSRVPICKVTTSPVTPGPSVILTITDCRPLLFRLGSGGVTPSPLYNFAWTDDPAGSARVDQAITVGSSSSVTANPFRGSDKNIRNLKEWMDAMMTRIKELAGSSYWFTAGGGGGTTINLVNLWWDTMMSQMAGTGAWSHGPANGQLAWSSDVYVYSTLGRYYYKILTGSRTLGNDQVLYLVHNRDAAFSSGITVIFDTTKNTVTSSTGLPGAFTGLVAGDWIKAVSDGVQAYSQLVTPNPFYDGPNGTGALTTAALAVSVLLTNVYDKGSNITTGGVYAKLSYTPGDLVVADRKDVPNDANVSWIAIREDGGGANPLIYLRNGSELKKGESIEISDETSEELLAYIGAADESISAPVRVDYAALVGSLASQQDYSSITGENLTVRDSKLTSMMADKAQDKTISIREGGLFTWDLATETLSWTSPILISIPSSAYNETIAAGSQVILAGKCIWFTIDRNAVAIDIRGINVDLEADVPLDEFTFVLAKRGADDKIYLIDGTVCVDTNPTGLGQYLWYRSGGYINPWVSTDGIIADNIILTTTVIAGTDVIASGQGIFGSHVYAGKNLYVGNWLYLDTPATGGGVISAQDGLETVLDIWDGYANSAFKIRSGSLDQKDSLGVPNFQYGFTLPYDIWYIDETGLQKTYGDFEVGTPSGYAAGTLTFTGLPTIGQTFIVNGITHTLVASASGANQITLSTVDAADQGNKVATDFNTWSAQATNCYAVSDGAGNVKFIWKTAGTVGNLIVFTTVMTNSSVDGAGFLGGTSLGIDEVINGIWSKTGELNAKKVIATNTLSYKRKKITLGYSDFAIAAFDNTVNIFSLPAGAAIKDIYANVTTEFSNPAVDEPITINGTVQGTTVVADTTGFYVGNYIAIDNTPAAAEIHGYIVAIADGVWAVGSLIALAGAALTDGDTFTINDGIAPYTFEFRSAGIPAPGNILVPFTILDTDAVVAASIIVAINGTAVGITASSGGGALVNLINDLVGIVGNVAITEILFAGTLTPTGMLGGLDAGGGFYGIYIQTAPIGGIDLDLSPYLVASVGHIYYDLSADVIEVGITGITNKYIVSGRDVFTGPIFIGASADKGAVISNGTTNIESFSISTNIVCKMTATGMLLNQFTQGSIDFYVCYEDIE